jgi:uncharacterized protein (DUF39 family)
MGDMKQMQPEWLVGVGIQGYGCSLAVGLGVPIPILNEEMARFTAVSDADLFTQIVDYGNDYPKGKSSILGQVSYAELKSGCYYREREKGPHGSTIEYGQSQTDCRDTETMDRIGGI